MDSQGNVVATGMDQAGYMDWMTIKTDAGGNLLWSRRYDSRSGNDETANMLVLDASDSVYVTGTGGPNPIIGTPAYLKGVVAKYDSDGTPQWTTWDLYANGKVVVLGEGNTLATLAWGYLVVTHYTETGQTDVLPGAPTNLAASAGFNRIDLSFVDHADNEFFVEVERCTGSGCTIFSMIGRTYGENSNGFRDTNIVAGVTYTYRVRAMGFMGASAYSNTVEASYQPSPPPAAPSSLTTAMSDANVVLNWQDNATNETQFYVERCQGAGCTAFMGLGAAGPNVHHLDRLQRRRRAELLLPGARLEPERLLRLFEHLHHRHSQRTTVTAARPRQPRRSGAQHEPDPADLGEQQCQPGPREDRALPRRRLHQLHPDRHRGGNGNDLHELGPERVHDLPVSRARSQLGRRFALLEHGLGENGQEVTRIRSPAGQERGHAARHLSVP